MIALSGIVAFLYNIHNNLLVLMCNNVLNAFIIVNFDCWLKHKHRLTW